MLSANLYLCECLQIYRMTIKTVTLIQGGKDLVAMLNVFGSSNPIIFVVFVETLGVFWFYGESRFCDDVEMMIGSRPSIFWRVCWKFISPAFLLV